MPKIYAPIYLLTTEAACWKCGRTQTVGALAGMQTDAPDSQSRRMVYYITSLPAELLALLVARLPRYRLHFSKTTRSEYFTNMCECGGNFGDFFLHSEPGEGFWPTVEDEARLVMIEELPLSGSFEIAADSETEGLELIFKYGTRVEGGS